MTTSNTITKEDLKNIIEELNFSVLAYGRGEIGEVKMYAGSTAPQGWLMCDGSAVSRNTYARLFEIIGTTYGAGDGETTFNLPDLRGRVVTGVGTLSGNTYTLGGAVNAGLPNITGSITASTNGYYQSAFENDGTVTKTGAFTDTTFESRNGFPDASDNYSSLSSLNFDASDSNAIYGNSTTVQPNTLALNFMICYDDSPLKGRSDSFDTHISTSNPTSADGNNGDIWIKYTVSS